jgi:hypothetical protein
MVLEPRQIPFDKRIVSNNHGTLLYNMQPKKSSGLELIALRTWHDANLTHKNLKIHGVGLLDLNEHKMRNSRNLALLIQDFHNKKTMKQ